LTSAGVRGEERGLRAGFCLPDFGGGGGVITVGVITVGSG
jgi:hypothetical protein